MTRTPGPPEDPPPAARAQSLTTRLSELLRAGPPAAGDVGEDLGAAAALPAGPPGRLLHRIRGELVESEGEYVIDDVAHHWVLYVAGVAEALLGVVLLAVAAGPPPLILGVIGAVVALDGAVRVLRAHLDRFVVTNFRVFRVWGLLNVRRASMPISRILDTTVTVPALGRLLGYGHFVFESAAQRQGLSLIRFIGRPDQREQTLQRVIQRSGLRRGIREAPGNEDDRPPAAQPAGDRAGSPGTAGGAGSHRGPGAPGHAAVQRPGSARRRRVGFHR